jgi:hypothetical protein
VERRLAAILPLNGAWNQWQDLHDSRSSPLNGAFGVGS